MDEKALEAAEEAWVRESVWGKGGHLGCLRAAITAYREASGEASCTWTSDEDLWEGACGVAWTFIDGGPEENHVRYCPECGGKLVIDTAMQEGK